MIELVEVTHWRRAYVQMFVRHRDQLRDDVRHGRRRYMSESKIDALAWRQAADTIELSIRQTDEAEGRRKARRSEAA
jgi:hypothetical protein